MKVRLRHAVMCLGLISAWGYGNLAQSGAGGMYTRSLSESRAAQTDFYAVARSVQVSPNLPIKLRWEFLRSSKAKAESSLRDARVGDQRVRAPRSQTEIISFLATIHKLIEKAELDHEESIEFSYGGFRGRLKLPYLGQGQHGKVFALAGKDEGYVLKLSQAHAESLANNKKESELQAFWERATTETSFKVPHEKSHDRDGVFRVIEKNNGETLTRTLIRYGLISIEDATTAATSYSSAALTTGPYVADIEKIALAMQEMMAICVANPVECPSLSPHNIHVTYVPGGGRL